MNYKRFVTIVTQKGFNRNNFDKLYEEFKLHKKEIPQEIKNSPQYRREVLGIFDKNDEKNKISPGEK